MFAWQVWMLQHIAHSLKVTSRPTLHAFLDQLHEPRGFRIGMDRIVITAEAVQERHVRPCTLKVRGITWPAW